MARSDPHWHWSVLCTVAVLLRFCRRQPRRGSVNERKALPPRHSKSADIGRNSQVCATRGRLPDHAENCLRSALAIARRPTGPVIPCQFPATGAGVSTPGPCVTIPSTRSGISTSSRTVLEGQLDERCGSVAIRSICICLRHMDRGDRHALLERAPRRMGTTRLCAIIALVAAPDAAASRPSHRPQQ